MLRALIWTAALSVTAGLFASENGLPVAHTGAFGEMTCAASGCHRPEPLNTGKSAKVSIEVGPYVPGATQPVVVSIDSRSGNRWGFQLTARRADDTTLPAGTFEAVNQFAAVRCPDGRFGPCNAGEVEYVTHTSVGTAPGGQPGVKMFFFNWTPPDSDVGEVVFAAAALAADGDRGTNSDITATTMTTSRYAPSNMPTISAGGVVSAAAVQRTGQTIASKQIISIFGSNLNAPDAAIEVGTADFDELGLIPDTLGRLSFVFTVPGDPMSYLGRMLYVSDTQANLQVPDLPSGATTAMVQPVINRQGGSSEVRGNQIQVDVRPYSPGLFTFGSTGVGAPAAVNGSTGQIVAPSSAGIAGSVLAKPGDVILLYGTGFGATMPAFEAGRLADQAADLSQTVTVEIGGMAAEVLYAGAAPNYAGLEQFNIKVPDLPVGEHDIIIRSSTFATQAGVKLSVGP